MKTWKKAVIFIVLLAVLILAGILLWPAPSPKPEPTIVEANTVVLSNLHQLGLSDVLVDTNDSRVLIRYNEPPGFDNLSAVFTIAARSAPLTSQIIVQTFDNFTPKMQYEADTSSVIFYSDGYMSEADFLQSLNATTLQ